MGFTQVRTTRCTKANQMLTATNRNCILTFYFLCIVLALILPGASCKHQPTDGDKQASSLQSVNPDTGKDNDAISTCIDEVSGSPYYGELRLGMNVENALDALPDNIAADDLEGPLRVKDKNFEIYSNVFPAFKLPLLSDVDLPARSAVDFQLVFEKDTLVRIALKLSPEYANDETASKLIRELRSKYSDKAYVFEGSVEAAMAGNGTLYRLSTSNNSQIELRIGNPKNLKRDDGYLALIYSHNNGVGDMGDNDFKAVLPNERDIAKMAQMKAPINGFEELQFGDSENVAVSNLPWGLSKENLPARQEITGENSHVIYGSTIPADKWDILRNIDSPSNVKIWLSLGFEAAGLEFVAILVPKRVANFNSLQELKRDLTRRYGKGMSYVYQPGGSFEGWTIYHKNGYAVISQPIDDEDGFVEYLVCTTRGYELYKIFCRK
jgi:hypothetical protein